MSNLVFNENWPDATEVYVDEGTPELVYSIGWIKRDGPTGSPWYFAAEDRVYEKELEEILTKIKEYNERTW